MRAPKRVLAGVVAAALLAGCEVAGQFPGRPVPEGPTDAGATSPPGSAANDGRLKRSPTAEGPLIPVLRVVDGDTIHVLRHGRDVTIRLIGMDTPEVDWYGGEAECFGARAGRFLTDLLDGERVRLEFDEERIDPYGRTLAYVYLDDGRSVNELLVRRGHATVTIFEPNDRYEDRLRAAEAGARSSGAGLWSACPVP